MKDNSPSRTAIIVAKSQALIGASPEANLPMDTAAVTFANRALEISGHGSFVRALRSKAFRRLLRGYESLMIPGLARHHVLRKQFIEARVRTALDSGIRQVIQVGAGLDSLYFRLHREFPDVTFLEWDHPATRKVKFRVLQSLEIGNNLLLRPLDLSATEPPCFHELTTKTNAPTMIIAEGVLMYLPRETVKAWLQRWRSACPNGSRLLFTHMDGRGFHRQSAAVDAWLRLAGEPFRWHAGSESVGRLLAETGWEISGSHATWRKKCDSPVAAGEWIRESCERLPRFNGVASPTQPPSVEIRSD